MSTFIPDGYYDINYKWNDPMSMNKHADDGLVALLKMGNRLAFHQIYGRYWKSLYNYTYNILSDAPLTEDCLQDIFVNLWVKREEIQIQNLQAYLFTSSRYKAISALRKIKLSKHHEAVIEELVHRPEVDAKLSLQDLHTEIEKVSYDLPKRCREIFFLSRFSDLSIREISDKLKISNRTVENQLSIALKHIRANISSELIVLIVLIF